MANEQRWPPEHFAGYFAGPEFLDNVLPELVRETSHDAVYDVLARILTRAFAPPNKRLLPTDFASEPQFLAYLRHAAINRHRDHWRQTNRAVSLESETLAVRDENDTLEADSIRWLSPDLLRMFDGSFSEHERAALRVYQAGFKRGAVVQMLQTDYRLSQSKAYRVCRSLAGKLKKYLLRDD